VTATRADGAALPRWPDDVPAVLHVDMDAFFASVEQLDDPSLRGKALIVGGTSGRGVVAAASYEVRRFGVRSAMPIRRALELCPHAICVKPRMARYQAVSAEVFAVFREFTPEVEGLSVDEAYLDVTASRRLKGDAVAIAAAIKQRIRDRTGLTASVGVAPNKLVAKIASDLEKPDGLTVVMPQQVHAVLDPLPVARLPGLGRKKGVQVLEAGLRTLGELRVASDAVLWPLFGHDAPRMRARAGGIDDRGVEPEREEVSISSEETFRDDVADAALLESALLALSDRTAGRLRRKGLVAGGLTVKIRRRDFATFTRARQLVPPTADSARLAGTARELLREWLAANPGAALRLLGVGVDRLDSPAQPDLFAPAGPPRDPRLDETLDRIRDRFGTAGIVRGGTLRRPR
jgi:DNA polymerase-4